jgi:thymidylate synthase (FAD)
MIQTSLIDHMGSDLSVVNAARVSFGKRSEWEYCCGEYCGDLCEENGTQCPKLSDRDTNLIHYLAKHKHLSPFGHAFASFHVKCPLFVHAQLVKHKFLRVNTISRRYVDDNIEFYVPDVWRGRSADKKQGSSDESISVPDINQCFDTAHEWYLDLLGRGVAPEMARMILPQSLMTEFIWSGSLDAFAAMCNLRLKEDTQYESRLVAQQISAKMSELFPVSWQALMEVEEDD